MRAAHSPASASIRARCRSLMRLSRPGSETIGIITTLCPGGKERMRRLMEVVTHGRVDLTPLLMLTFSLNQIKDAYEIFGKRAEGMIKVAIKP
jgi:threonine dehydrogenase-like Zn-dependent dehydrogenase